MVPESNLYVYTLQSKSINLLELLLNLPVGYSLEEAQLVGDVLEDPKNFSVAAYQQNGKIHVAKHTPQPSRARGIESLDLCSTL
jgi:hypothetical protein